MTLMGCHLSFFPVAVIKHYDQSNLSLKASNWGIQLKIRVHGHYGCKLTGRHDIGIEVNIRETALTGNSTSLLKPHLPVKHFH